MLEQRPRQSIEELNVELHTQEKARVTSLAALLVNFIAIGGTAVTATETGDARAAIALFMSTLVLMIPVMPTMNWRIRSRDSSNEIINYARKNDYEVEGKIYRRISGPSLI